MIPDAHVTAWGLRRPWASRDQVEQDLLLERVVVEVARHPYLGNELVFRGGTCLHKLHLPEPWRYSEDLDYVRATGGPISGVLDALRDVAAQIGLTVGAVDVGPYPKVQFRTVAQSGARLRLKIEMNTYERSPARPHVHLPLRVDSRWWAGEADVLTFATEELVATKLRAMHQRKKGRDLFDLWLALTELALDPEEVLRCFAPYRPDGYTRATALATFDAHVGDPVFRTDLDQLVVTTPAGYDIDAAAMLVRSNLLDPLDDP
ncbi:MAG TPA: nucleotidyl transferase AbiEii/AbiGii toxin family protein [Mycobacteriales bacterium]|nr:nucleotidyl transferase AbiEii/AbiGii toxin family protein [Mycobacteriales bacterium]